ncbi:hypothetical protein C8R45DRAFT_1110018 [Mycena sanguinolenta]|nr:hypothetical protein C8R45DRAFT_1110018 [Mycena sanguinolenta]
MSTDQRNNGNTMPPSPPSGNKDKGKNPEMEEREEMTEEERKQQKLEALMRILDVKEKEANEKLERIRHKRERAGALSEDIKAHRLDDLGEAELADLLRGSSPRRNEVSDETNNESSSEEDVYQAPLEKDGGKKRRRAERKRERKGKGKQLGRPEKRRRTEKALPETEDPEVKRLDEAGAWVEGETSCHLCTQSGVLCLLPPSNSRKKACWYCRLRKAKCSILLENENRQPTVRRRVPEVSRAVAGPSRLGGQSSGHRVPEVRGASPVRHATRNTRMQRELDVLTGRVDESNRRAEQDQALLRRLALRVLQQDPEIAWARQYLHATREESDDDSDSSSSSSSSEEDEDTKRVKLWAKKVGVSEKDKDSSLLEDGDGDEDGDADGDVDIGGSSTEMVPPTGMVDGPVTFGPFATTSDGNVFHVNVESTTVVVKTEEEEHGILGDNEEDLARRGRLRKKNKAKAKAKATEAEKPTEEGAETVVKTEEQETQVSVTVQPPAPGVVQGPGVFFETATSTGKLIPVQVEMIEVLDSDDEALAL